MWQFTMSSPVSGLYGPGFEKKPKSGGIVPGLVCFTGIAALHIAVFSAAPFFTRDRPPVPAATELLLTLQAAVTAGAAEPVEAPPVETTPAPPRKTAETADAPVTVPPLEEAAAPAEERQEVEAAGPVEEAYVEAGGVPVADGVPAAEAGEGPARKAAMTDAEYLALVMALLEKNKIYPMSARKRGIEGDIRAEFTIRRDGSVSGMRLADASGHRFLAQAAFETIRSAAPFPVMEGRGGDYKVEVTIRYQLEG